MQRLLAGFAAMAIYDLDYVQQSREEMDVFAPLSERHERGSVTLTGNPTAGRSRSARQSSGADGHRSDDRPPRASA